MTDTTKLRALATAATCSPWINAAMRADQSEVRMEFGGFPEHGYSAWLLLRGRDANYIAAAHPAAILALLDELDRARAEVERVR